MPSFLARMFNDELLIVVSFTSFYWLDTSLFISYFDGFSKRKLALE